MKNAKTLTILSVCCIRLAAATTASADFVGMVSEFKTDAETADQCGEANGVYVAFPLTVCNVFVQFDDLDRLLAVAFSDLQVMNGAVPDVFYHHIFGGNVPYNCDFLTVFPDLICDSFVTIGEKCAGNGSSTPDGDFDTGEFNDYGHIVGGWFNANPSNMAGDAYPYGKVLILQSAVAQGLTLEGSATVFWTDSGYFDVFENEVEIACGPGCPDDYLCGDGDPCTEGDICNNQVCQGTPIDCSSLDDDCNKGFCTDGVCQKMPINEGGTCDDGFNCTENDACSDGVCSGDPIYGCDDDNPCTTDYCDEATGCVNANNNNDCDDGDACTVQDQCVAGVCVAGEPVECPKDQPCDPKTGKCVSECGDCPTDANGDGETGPFDLATLLAAWGPVEPVNCLDANTDGDIGPFDLATLLAAWGPCP